MGIYNGLDVNLQYTSDPANGTVLEKDVVVKFYYANQEIGEGIFIKVTQPYTVKFYDGIDSSKPLYTTEAVDGELLKLPSDPNRENYIFDCWYIRDEKVTSKYIVKSNLELIAKWTANGYTIKYELNGGTNDQSNSSNYNVESGEITLAAATKTGYTFGGWYKDENFSGEKITQIAKGSTGNLTLYAQWTANTYTVKFDANGGSGTMTDQTFTYDVAKDLTANTFTREGYTFAGWAESAGGNVVYADKKNVKNLTAEDKATVTLYAVWTKNGTVLPVTFEPQSGSEIDCGDTITLSCTTDGAKISYTIGGETKEYTDKIVITDDVTITAYASKDGMRDSEVSTASYTVKTYTVTYKSDYDTAPSDVAGLKKGDKLTAEQLPVLTTDGYTFGGWYNDENEVTTKYKITGDLNLTAQWTANTYTVKFDANVSDNSVTNTMDDQTFTYDIAKELTANTFTRTGYTFAGWNTQPDGKGTSYADKASVLNLTATANGEVTLYAQWAEANAYYVSNNGNDNDDGTVYNPFKTVQEAVNTINNINDGTSSYTIYVMNDITGTDSEFTNDNKALINVVPGENETLHLKICGYNNADVTIDANQKGRVMYIEANANVTLENITLSNGKIIDDVGGGVCIFGGNFTMSNGAVIRDCTSDVKESGGGGVAMLGGSFTMNNNAKISSCNADNNNSKDFCAGGGVYVSDGTFTLSDTASIDDCNALSDNNDSRYGGGVYLAGGKFNMTGGSIKNCDVTGYNDYGGGVYQNAGTFEMTGGTISGCTAEQGGGVYKYSGVFKMQGGTIGGGEETLGCTANQGGGVYLGSLGSSSISSGIISNCSAKQGGGVYYNGDSNNTFTMYSGEISKCTAEQGGGVYVNNGKFKMSGSAKIDNCKASEKGGGVYQNGGNFEIFYNENGTNNNVIISNNTAKSGGGVCVYSGIFNMNSGSITGNTASSTAPHGAGVDVLGTFNMFGGSITENTLICQARDNDLPCGGAGVAVEIEKNNVSTTKTGTFKMSGGTIKDNIITKNNNNNVFGVDVYVVKDASFTNTEEGTINNIYNANN